MLNLFNLSLKISGYPIEKAKQQLSEILSVPDNEYAHFIENKKKEIVRFHLENNLFYKSFIGESDVTTWENIPIMKKIDFM